MLRDESKICLTKSVYGLLRKEGMIMGNEQIFVFNKLPETVDELKASEFIAMDTPFKTTALAMAVLCNFEKNRDETYEMLDVLRGPDPLSPYDRQFINERLNGKGYKAFSFFEGAKPENGYKPLTPYTISVSDNMYSYADENWATLYVMSSGADSSRPVKLRKKPSTGQWFINDIQCLSDIRVPVSDDPWA